MNGNETIVLEVSYSKEDFRKICRFCFSKTDESSLVDLFVVQYEDLFVNDILERLFGDRLISIDELPQNVCQRCIVEIIRCYNFKKAYDISNLILQAVILSNLKERPEKLFQTINPAELCEVSSAQEEPKQDLLGDTIEAVAAGNFTRDVSVHRKTHTKPKKSNLYTSSTILKSDSAEPTIEEIISREDNFDNNTSTTDRVAVDPKILEAKLYRCACGETFRLESEFIQHKKEKNHKSSRKNYCCKLCNKFFNRTQYIEHRRTHTKEKPFVCEICSERFTLVYNLMRHIRIKHEGKKAYVCDFCGKRFGRLFSLKVHERIHTGEKPHLCDICGQGFSNNSRFTEHKARCTGKCKLRVKREQKTTLKGTKPECILCNKKLSSQASLQQHMLLHGERKFSCDSCAKTFFTKAALEIHTVTHTGVKAFPCDLCSRNFAHASSLQIHKRMHSGLKPYRCKFCSKAFRQGPHLKTHVRRVHTGERPYVCKFCRKSFADSGALLVHERIHTGERPYGCDFCSKAFYHSSTMKKHRQIHFKRNAKVKSEPFDETRVYIKRKSVKNEIE